MERFGSNSQKSLDIGGELDTLINMKINLSRKELLSILSSRFGYEVTDYTITKEPRYVENLTIRMEHMNAWPIRADNKIACIKALRTEVPNMGLAEAKWAIENWPQWSAAAKKFNAAPKMVFVNNAFGATSYGSQYKLEQP